MIARGVTDVFSAAVRSQLGKGLGERAPGIGLVQLTREGAADLAELLVDREIRGRVARKTAGAIK